MARVDSSRSENLASQGGSGTSAWLRNATPFAALLCASLVGCGLPEGPPGSALATTTPRVLHTTRRLTTQLVTLRSTEAIVVTTPEHPFAQPGIGLTKAIELAVGDRIVTRGGGYATLVAVEVREVPPTPVYNLTVEKTPFYFVSDRDLLVHNDDCPPRTTLRELLARERAEERKNRKTLRQLLDEERERELAERDPFSPAEEEARKRARQRHQRVLERLKAANGRNKKTIRSRRTRPRAVPR